MKQISLVHWTTCLGMLSLGFTGLMSACGTVQTTPTSAPLSVTALILWPYQQLDETTGY
ncbi:MAG TPA: hypothetical protein VGS16_05940 [Candidatus Dormibacteraeota bacterium]|nr:hypothetical protein [Candidatus Dormibacteraeota bacterium]